MAKTHFLVIALFAALAATLAHAQTTATYPADNTFTLTGKLATGIMAIGGESTGITLTTSANATYELDIKDAGLKKAAEALNGANVTVTGTLTIKAGIEVAQRRIIAVATLEPAKTAATSTAPASSPAPAAK
ncbi:MAG TPA: hypothetical protein VHM90_08930 [Phycisphaerae bacterium]|nr:hypothetical protein [Phycisphaerae bacterium]